jgi:hypothetical protein
VTEEYIFLFLILYKIRVKILLYIQEYFFRKLTGLIQFHTQKLYSVWVLVCNKVFCKLHTISEDRCTLNNHSCKFVFVIISAYFLLIIKKDHRQALKQYRTYFKWWVNLRVRNGKKSQFINCISPTVIIIITYIRVLNNHTTVWIRKTN